MSGSAQGFDSLPIPVNASQLYTNHYFRFSPGEEVQEVVHRWTDRNTGIVWIRYKSLKDSMFDAKDMKAVSSQTVYPQ